MNNRRVGHNRERFIRRKLRDSFYPECRTTRESSSLLDSLKIDLSDTGNWAFQIKDTKKLGALVISDVLDCMKQGLLKAWWKPKYRAIIWNMKVQPFPRTAVVIIPYSDFLELLKNNP